MEYVVNAGLKPFAGSVVKNLVPQLNGSGFVLRRFVHAANHARDQLSRGQAGAYIVSRLKALEVVHHQILVKIHRDAQHRGSRC